jgi:hypothetical protein
MSPIAHIGDVPVEEWLPFLFPIIALYLYGRHSNRRRHREIERLPPLSEGLDERTEESVLERWAAAGHEHLRREHVALMYPPGPQGATAAELAANVGRSPAGVAGQLEDLQELGYLDLESEGGGGETRAWLTLEGFDLLTATEEVLLQARGSGADADASAGSRLRRE